MMKIKDILQSIPKKNTELQRDTRFLLAHLLNQPVTSLFLNQDYLLNNQEYQLFTRLYKLLLAGKPLAYVLGSQPFWSLNFVVNEHTLIPRFDTTVLVEQALSCGDTLQAERLHLYKDAPSNKPLYVLEMGTGSGIIAVVLKHEREQWHVIASDVSAEALAVAKQNASNNRVDVNFIQGFWYGALEQIQSPTRFDLIISNPPYIDKEDPHLLALTHEPISALVAEDSGLSDIKHIVKGAKNHLYNGGYVALEHGYNQGLAVRQIFSDYGFAEIKTIQDYAKNDRVTVGRFFK